MNVITDIMLDYLDIKALCVLYANIPTAKYHIKKYYGNGLPLSLYCNCTLDIDGYTISIQKSSIQILLNGQDILTAKINRKTKEVIVESLYILSEGYYLHPGILEKIIIELINEDFHLITKPKSLYTPDIRNLELSESTLMAIPNHIVKQLEINSVGKVDTLHDKFVIF